MPQINYRVVQGAFGRATLHSAGPRQQPHAHRQPQWVVAFGPDEVVFAVGGAELRAVAGEAIRLPACTEHHLLAAGPCTLLLTLDLECATGAGPDVLRLDDAAWCAARALRDHLSADRLTVSASDIGALIDALLGVHRSASGTAQPTPRIDRRIARSIDAMQAGMDEHDKLGDLAREYGLSRPQFYKLFQQTFHLSPGVYRNMLRMERALSGIADPRKNLADISAELGFSGQANFSRFFRNVQGVSPNVYRRAVTEAA